MARARDKINVLIVCGTTNSIIEKKSHKLVENIKKNLVGIFHRRATLQYYYINNEKNPPEDIYYGLKEGEYNCIESIIDIDRCGWNVNFDILVLECCPLYLFASPRPPFSHIPSDFQLFLENLPPLSDNCILATPNYEDYQSSGVAGVNFRNIMNNFFEYIDKVSPYASGLNMEMKLYKLKSNFNQGGGEDRETKSCCLYEIINILEGEDDCCDKVDELLKHARVHKCKN